ncbi:hypothetical protein CANCADRAFT_78372 [Tortispora caseinolytica NRRL Y-17796]|uniref:Acyl-protein thioesterase 1 n=1 Tax=Tortispora caseinolytica NRRL Y-17796 TaxID=767744 RepID=A0A1E4TJG0_9ASCO|nr:hypothetical protein CANCADRAFT_78372 [Tortispora caseinolytica NRRL Y-17796]
MSLSSVKIASRTTHKCTVIFLHGLGDSGAGWSFLADECSRLSEFNSVKFVFPNAPVMPITCNGGMPMPGWYDIYEFGSLSHRLDESGMESSVKKTEQLLEDEAKEVGSSNVLLGGFSQGCAVSLLTALTTKHKLAGIVGLSGYLPPLKYLDENVKDVNKNTPVFIGHGTSDPVVPFEQSKVTESKLKGLGFKCERHEYPGVVHSCSPDEFQDLLAFMRRALKL